MITQPVRIFAPGRGAVAGYAVMRIDLAVVAVQVPTAPDQNDTEVPVSTPTEPMAASEEMRQAFT